MGSLLKPFGAETKRNSLEFANVLWGVINGLNAARIPELAALSVPIAACTPLPLPDAVASLLRRASPAIGQCEHRSSLKTAKHRFVITVASLICFPLSQIRQLRVFLSDLGLPRMTQEALLEESHNGDEQPAEVEASDTIKIKPQEAQKMLGNMTENDPATERLVYKAYAKRWIVLAVVALLNNTNTLTWISFASIANHVDTFYHQQGAANWFSMIYMMCTIPVGVIAMWAGNRFGLRWSILIAAWSNGLGTVIRLVSTFLPPPYRFALGITGQGIAAVAYPFIMFLPTKVAASWFPESQRALATTIGIMSNPLGVLMANVISPLVVSEPEHVKYINMFVCIPSVLVCLAATFTITRSEPKIPPSVSAAQEQMGFLSGVKACFTSKEYLILLLVMGGGIGMFNCLYTVMQQLLCPSGYSNTFSGIGMCASLMILGGVVGAFGSGVFVDKTKRYAETMKGAMAIAVLFGVIFLQLTLHPGLNFFILANCVLFGIFGLATYPVGLEMSAECAFPVSETTSTGLIVLSGQVQSIIFVALIGHFSKPLMGDRLNHQVCKVGDDDSAAPMDATVASYMFSGIAVALVLILVLFFKPVYKRLEAEGKAALTEGTDLVEQEDGDEKKESA
uniref:MFS domain-containing protein n=1 Tax=Steinernema glaseri TaxID=37863 RepID=A0A1I7YXX5_9BILA